MKEFCKRIDRGSVVNILDNKIAFNQYHYAAYLISKKALADVTKMAALEFAPQDPGECHCAGRRSPRINPQRRIFAVAPSGHSDVLRRPS